MRVVVIGGSGLIGAQLVALLAQAGHEVLAASPSRGVDAVTGEGLAAALAGADIVVDSSNAPSFADAAVLDFFTRSSRNLASVAQAAGVRHLVALSVVGTDRLQQGGYFRAKLVQEQTLIAAGLPYSILRATQFHEFVGAIAAAATEGDVVRVPDALLQPVASEDVASALADIAMAGPGQGLVELGGPEALPFADFVQAHLAAHVAIQGSSLTVRVDKAAQYFGIDLAAASLLAAGNARRGKLRFADWLRRRSGAMR